MAIRIGLPPTIFPRLRIGWHTTRVQLQRRATAFRQSILRFSTVSRTGWGSLVQRLPWHRSLRLRSLNRQCALLEQFEEQYEELVDILCWGAKDGDHTGLETRYARIRSWMQVHYRPLRSRLRPHWGEPNSPATSDPFEALFASDNVEEILHAHNSIEDIMVTRAALEAYREGLETLQRSL